jgi:hypothetical protein
MLENASFQRLPSWSQTEILTRKGTLLAQRNHNGWSVRLYSLHYHFVEHWAKDGVEVATTFKLSASPLAILEPYMEDINLADFTDI